MKSLCGSQQGFIHSVAALSVGWAVRVGTLCSEPLCSRPLPQWAEGNRMALNKPAVSGFISLRGWVCPGRGDSLGEAPQVPQASPAHVAQDAQEGGWCLQRLWPPHSQPGIMLLMNVSHKLAERHPSTLALASLEFILRIYQSEKGQPFPYEILCFGAIMPNRLERDKNNANSVSFKCLFFFFSPQEIFEDTPKYAILTFLFYIKSCWMQGNKLKHPDHIWSKIYLK